MSLCLVRTAAALILGTLAGCSFIPLATAPSTRPAPHPSTTPAAAPPPAPLLPELILPGEPEHPHARWVPTGFAELPGWGTDRVLDLWPALRRSCNAAPSAWRTLCAEALLDPPLDEPAARRWFEARLQVFRVEAATGEPVGLATGYFEPLVEARRRPQGPFRTPLWAPPADLAVHKPWWTRQEIDSTPEAQAALRGREIAWVADPLDALLLQVQGSGRLHLVEPDGSERVVRVAYAAHNEQPYRSVGRWLIDQGEMKITEASWPAIRDWGARHPRRVTELLQANPRVVFFREEALPDPGVGPKGAQGVPLTPGRSIAVDPASVPYGASVWLDTTEPLSTRPLQRLVMAQDTGSAITGAVRADFFWGWGDDAEQQAGRMKQPLRLWVLWPRS
jgi:membrane-bound lytic murein transglycosylase A